MDTLQAQLDDLRRQTKEDFQFTMLAMGTAREHLEKVTQHLGQVEGRMARQEERFEMMLDIVQKMMAQVEDRQRSELEAVDRKFSQVFQRLEALEQDRPPAA